jgi:hypothetical protein
MAGKVPGEAGGRRNVKKDAGSPRAGRADKAKGKIQGSEVKFKTAGGKQVGHGGKSPSLLRIIGDVLKKGKHGKTQ